MAGVKAQLWIYVHIYVYNKREQNRKYDGKHLHLRIVLVSHGRNHFDPHSLSRINALFEGFLESKELTYDVLK